MESLSLLRTDDECLILRNLFPKNIKIIILLVLREPEEFLYSYKRQLLKTGMPFSVDKNSAHYVNADSWLVDYGSLQRIFSKHFDSLKIFEYRRSGILDELVAYIGINANRLDKIYRLNSTKKFILIDRASFLLKNRIASSYIGSKLVKINKLRRRMFS